MGTHKHGYINIIGFRKLIKILEMLSTFYHSSKSAIQLRNISPTWRYWISTLIESKSNLPTRSYLYPRLRLAAGDYREGGCCSERRRGKGLIDGGASRRYFSTTRYYFIIPRHRSSIIRNHFLAHSLSASSADQFKFCPVARSRSRAFTH